MSRRTRIDPPGSLHHISSRGVNQRTFFETRADVRYFLSLVAREVRKRRLRVLAYSALTNHFHIVARSPQGCMSAAMQQILSQYVRYFNRTRARFGHFVERRYWSKQIRSRRQLFNSIRYTDMNAPEARLVDAAPEYPFGSAIHYASRRRRPRWLDTQWIDDFLGNPAPTDRARRYAESLGLPLTRDEVEVMEQRLSSTAEADEDEWDSLISGTPDFVWEWMLEKARVADGSRPGLAFVGATSVIEAVARRSRAGSLLGRGTGRRRRNCWPVMATGLLRFLAGQTYPQIGERMGVSDSTAGVQARLHARLVREDEDYRAVSVEIAMECFRVASGGVELPQIGGSTLS